MALAKQTKAAPAQKSRVSINPDSATQGLLDDVDVTITDAMTCMWDYNGQQPAGPAMAVEFTDANGGEHTQYFSAGKAEDWEPEDSGEGFLSSSGKSGINVQSNFMKFMTSLVECGFPKEQLDEGNVKVIVGTHLHINQVAVERAGLIRKGDNADRPSTVLLCTKIHSLPGEGKKGAGKGAAAATSTKAAVSGKANGAAKSTPAAEPAGDSLDETITSALLEALGEAKDGTIAKKQVAQVVFKAFSDDTKSRNKAVARAASAEFLKSLAESGIQFDGSSLSLG